MERENSDGDVPMSAHDHQTLIDPLCEVRTPCLRQSCRKSLWLGTRHLSAPKPVLNLHSCNRTHRIGVVLGNKAEELVWSVNVVGRAEAALPV